MVGADLPVELTFRLLHVGVAVPSLCPAADSLKALLGYQTIAGPVDEPLQKVTVQFLAQADDISLQLELVTPLGNESPIGSMLRANGGGAYHLCFETSNMELALHHVRSHGCLIVSPPAPSMAFKGKRIAWFYTPTRQLFELVEQNFPGDDPGR